MISLDCETTGLDPHHGTKPFFITSSDVDGNQSYWEWDVDPLTRQPIVIEEDIQEIYDLVHGDNELVLQNSKFDVAMLTTVDKRFKNWPWEKTDDLLLIAHLLHSGRPKDLTALASQYLRIDIEPYEIAIDKATKEARKMVLLSQRRKEDTFKGWQLARKDRADMPSAGGKLHKADMWLPRAVAKKLKYSTKHPWWTVLREYANIDSHVTAALLPVMRAGIKYKGLWAIYECRRKVMAPVHQIESSGVTASRERMNELHSRFALDCGKAHNVCHNIAKSMDFELELSSSGSNTNSLREFVFGPLAVPVVATSAKTGAPTLDKGVVEHSLATLPRNSKGYTFLSNLKSMRKAGTSISYIDSYDRYGIGIQGYDDFFRLFSSLNPAGTGTLRFSSNNPNSQNISKQEYYSVRYGMGPLDDREWWSLDYENVEMRIPAFESKEKMLMELFLKPNDPPFFGSFHLMNASIVYPELFNQKVCPDCLGTKKLSNGDRCRCTKTKVPLWSIKGGFKKLYENSFYQFIKNFGFAVSYGAVPESGTADRAAHRAGAHLAVINQLTEHSKLNRAMIDMAKRRGYVETIPDKTVDPRRGYPIYCTMSEWGKIIPTVPLNYHVQGTAMWCTMKAMIRCYDQLKDWTSQQKRRFFMTMQIHDEIVLDFPKGKGEEPWRTHVDKILVIKKLMEKSGDDISIPLKVSVKYHPNNWAQGLSVC